MSTKDSRIIVRSFNTYVRPLLEYGTAVSNSQKKKLIRKLESVQNNLQGKYWFVPLVSHMIKYPLLTAVISV